MKLYILVTQLVIFGIALQLFIIGKSKLNSGEAKSLLTRRDILVLLMTTYAFMNTKSGDFHEPYSYYYFIAFIIYYSTSRLLSKQKSLFIIFDSATSGKQCIFSGFILTVAAIAFSFFHLR